MTRGRIAVGTVFAGNYVSLARVLADSFRRHHPDVHFFGVLADRSNGQLRASEEPFRVIGLAELSIPDLRSLAFRYSRFQMSVAVKGYLLEHLLDAGYESALFLDPDTFVLGDLDPLLEQTQQAAITLVPHLLRPLEDSDRGARELNILQSGTLNGGVVGVRSCGAARRFLEWWQERVYLHCRHALVEGLHFDQRWLDLAPVFFPEIHVFRDPRLNVAHWNLPERLGFQRDWRLFHFSGYEPDRPGQLTRYTMRVALNGEPALLVSRYQRALEAAGWHETKGSIHTFDFWDNGVPIPDLVRAVYGDLGRSARRFGDPFRTASPDSFFHWLLQPLDGDHRVTHLWAEVVRRRPDVVNAFPDPFGADRERFVAWTVSSGAAEHDIPDALMRT